MMRFRPLSRLRSYLLPAVAAIFLAVGPMACSSSGEESPNPALEGATAGEESESGNNAGANGEAAAENGNAAAANANTENSNTAQPEGEAAASNNPIGNELNNAIANEQGGGGGNAAPAEEGGGAINAEVNGNAAATNFAAEPPPAEASNPAFAADANSGNPFASSANSAAVPSNAAPYDPGTAASAAPTETAPVPADASVASEPVAASAGDTSSAAAPTGPTALPEIGSKMAYYVMRGDTLGAIAQKIYGSRKKWKALQAENGLADANKIYPGDVIYFTLDDASKAFAENYEIGNRQAYTVSKGDTLSRLAAKFYGTQGAWRALWKENPQVLNPDRIRVGMVLTYRATSKVAIKDENEAELETQSDDNDENAEAKSGNGEDAVGSVEGEFTQLTASVE